MTTRRQLFAGVAAAIARTCAPEPLPAMPTIPIERECHWKFPEHPVITGGWAKAGVRGTHREFVTVRIMDISAGGGCNCRCAFEFEVEPGIFKGDVVVYTAKPDMYIPIEGDVAQPGKSG